MPKYHKGMSLAYFPLNGNREANEEFHKQESPSRFIDKVGILDQKHTQNLALCIHTSPSPSTRQGTTMCTNSTYSPVTGTKIPSNQTNSTSKSDCRVVKTECYK
eukprot:c43915_g1_i1 orf=174-485(+)